MVMTDQSARDRMMGRELRELRQFRRLSARDVDQVIKWRTNKATELERGQIAPRIGDVTAYLSVFGMNLADLESVLEARSAYEAHPIHARLLAEGDAPPDGV